LRGANLRLRPAIDHAGRQVQQQIDQPRRLIAPQQIAQELVLLRPDAGKARDQRKQRIEQGGAHWETFKSVSRRHARPCAGHPRLFYLVLRSNLSRVEVKTWMAGQARP
jgi:hypothetical protein